MRNSVHEIFVIKYKMHIFEAWIIYLIVVVVVWVILAAVDAFNGMSQGAKLFLALLIGAIFVLFAIGSIEIYCPDDRFWFCLLLLLAFLAPLLIGIWLLCKDGWDSVKNFAMKDECCGPKVDRTFVCHGDNCYPISTKIKGKCGKTTIIHQ